MRGHASSATTRTSKEVDAIPDARLPSRAASHPARPRGIAPAEREVRTAIEPRTVLDNWSMPQLEHVRAPEASNRLGPLGPRLPGEGDDGRRRSIDVGRALRRLAIGVSSGVVATAVMTLGLAGARSVGLLGEPPPRTLTRRMLGRMGIRLGKKSLDVAASLSHVAYGAACGALYGLVARRRAGVASGALFGLSVWAVSYQAWIPAMGLMPPPTHDRPGRPTAMVLAHLLFGGALGATQRWASVRTSLARPSSPDVGPVSEVTR